MADALDFPADLFLREAEAAGDDLVLYALGRASVRLQHSENAHGHLTAIYCVERGIDWLGLAQAHGSDQRISALRDRCAASIADCRPPQGIPAIINDLDDLRREMAASAQLVGRSAA